MSVLGTDFHAVDDITRDWAQARDDRLAFAQALYRRLRTPRGLLFYAPLYGRDLLHYLLENITISQMSGEIQQELLKDERVQSASIEVRAEDILISVQSHRAPSHPLTLSIDKVTAELLISQGSP